MAKRGGSELNHLNWDQDDPGEAAGVFQKVPILPKLFMCIFKSRPFLYSVFHFIYKNVPDLL